MVGNLKRMRKEWMGVDVCFFGHTHLPMSIAQGNIQSGEMFQEEVNVVQLERGKPTLVNVGSVGQPRDGDPRASFGIFDAAKGTVTVHRLEYDVEATMDKVRKAGLPSFLADRLELGK